MTVSKTERDFKYAERNIEQYRREVEQYRESEQRYRDTVENTSGKCEKLTAFKIMINQLVQPMVEGLEEDILDVKGGTAFLKAKLTIDQYDLHDLCYMTLRHVLCFANEVRYLRNTCEDLGKEVAEHARFAAMMEMLNNYTKNGTPEQQKMAWSTLKLFKDKAEKFGDTLGLETTYTKAHKFLKVPKIDWDDDLKYRIGMVLINACIKYTGVIRAAKTYRSVEKENENPGIYILTYTKEFSQQMEDLHGRLEVLKPHMKPMVCEPRDWVSLTRGGLLTNGDIRNYPLVRTRKKHQKDAFMKGDHKGLFDVVNKLQTTEWTVNRRVAAALMASWEADKGLGKLPRQDVKDVLPPEPWSSEKEKIKMRKEKPPVYKEYISKCISNGDDWKDKESLRLTIERRLELLNEFGSADRFWYTYFCDYRYRIYPLQNILTPQGDDTAKASIMFAKGEPLETEEGAYWFMVHGANCFGVDKVPFDDRVQWVKDHHDLIMDSARDPFSGKKFWAGDDCDKPFSFLAFCFEYADWADTGFSLDFKSHLPIAMDGSNNGLQHLCAMSRSLKGARVNLTPQEKPADFYTDIANICDELAEQWMYDEEKDEKTRGICAVLKGNISRKLVKRPSMTIAYSSTFQGWISQIRDEIKKADAKISGTGRLFECEYKNFDIAVTLAKLVGEALKKGMEEPMRVMAYIQHLNKCCAVEGINFEWRTPMGMVCSQAYYKSKRKTIKSYFGEVKVRVGSQEDVTDAKGNPLINPMTSKNGSAPNFVHSMDSAHLQRVILRGFDEGIHSWAMIHDSYGCHARFCGRMREIINEEFVNIYKEDVLQDLYEYTKARLTGPGLDIIDDVKPIYGALDINDVLKSSYFFA